MARTPIRDFELANPLYKNASVSFYTVASGIKTSTLATLYSGASGSAQLSNPQKLNSQGQFKQPVYIADQVIGVISGISVPGHDTGIISPSPTFRVQQTTGKLQYSYDAGVNWSDSGDYIFKNRGAWVTGTAYYRNDAVIEAGYLYIGLEAHTAGVFATDLAAGKWLSILANADVFALAQWAGTATGTANALALTVSPAITAYAAGQVFRFKSGAAANTAAATVAVSGLAAKAVQRDGAALTGGEIAASKWYEVLYDGAAFQLTQFGSDLALGLSSGSNAIGFLQGGTGAEARTLQSKGRDSIDLADFGVVGDGSDELTKVQAAFTAAVSTGKKVVTAHGMTVSIKGAITVDGTMSIQFSGGAGFKAITPFVNSSLAGQLIGAMMIIDAPYVQLEGVHFDANDIAAAGGSGVGQSMVPIWQTLNADYCTIKYCNFFNVKYAGGGLPSCAVTGRFNNHPRLESCNFIECCAAVAFQNCSDGVIANNFCDGRSDGNGAGTVGICDTIYAFDGTGKGCQMLNNRIHYTIPGQITSAIGITGVAEDFLVSGNHILGLFSGAGINIDISGPQAYGTVCDNFISGLSGAGALFKNTWTMINNNSTNSNITFTGNTLTAGTTGYSGSIGLKTGTSVINIKNNTFTVSDCQAAVYIAPNDAYAGKCVVADNFFSTDGICIYIDCTGTGHNNGEPIWIANNQFNDAQYGIQAVGPVGTGNRVTESTTPIFMKDNEFDILSNFAVLGTKWDVAFNVAGSGAAHKFPHYCGERTNIQTYVLPGVTPASWTTGHDTGFNVGDQFWSNAAASGGSPGEICTTAGLAGGAGVFKAMANLA